MHNLIEADVIMKKSLFKNILRIVLGLFMTLAGVGHLTFQRQEFQAQVPSWLPDNPAFIDFVVISSGIVEIIFGLCLLLLVKKKVFVGIGLAIFFLLVFPGNISQYLNEVDAFGLDTDLKRLIRLFFQPILILWALWSTDALYHLMNRTKTQNT